METYPAKDVSLILEHVETCQCTYVLVNVDEVKLVDARCIFAYVTPSRGSKH